MLWSAMVVVGDQEGDPESKPTYLYEEIEELSHALVRPLVERGEEGGREDKPTCMK
jgi:hypothetical protein